MTSSQIKNLESNKEQMEIELESLQKEIQELKQLSGEMKESIKCKETEISELLEKKQST